MALYLLEGHSPPDWFNEVLYFFLPTGDMDGDFWIITRQPDEARPIGLRNADNKAILAVLTAAHGRAFARQVHWTQGGGTPSRNFAESIVCMDTEMRLAGLITHDNLNHQRIQTYKK